MHPTTQACYSPDERLILTGVSAGRDGTGGAIVFFDAQSRELVRRVGMPSSVVALQWHSKLNQIFVGVGMSSLSPSYVSAAHCSRSLALYCAYIDLLSWGG